MHCRILPEQGTFIITCMQKKYESGVITYKHNSFISRCKHICDSEQISLTLSEPGGGGHICPHSMILMTILANTLNCKAYEVVKSDKHCNLKLYINTNMY